MKTEWWRWLCMMKVGCKQNLSLVIAHNWSHPHIFLFVVELILKTYILTISGEVKIHGRYTGKHFLMIRCFKKLFISVKCKTKHLLLAQFHWVWLLSKMSLSRMLGILVIMILLLVMALTVPPEALELCCILTMSPLVCSGSARRKRCFIVAWGQ